MRNRERNCILIILILLTFFAGCMSNKRDVEETGPVDEDTVIWMTDVPTFDVDFEEKFNEKLREKGCEFRVDFRGTPDEEYWHYTETGDLPDYSKADIVLLMGEYFFTSYYSDLARNGDLYNLTDYLAGEAGQKVYNSMPEEVWTSMEVDGDIYGFLNPNVEFNTYIALRQDCLERYSFQVNETLTMEKLIQMACIIYEKEGSVGRLLAYPQYYLPDTYMIWNNRSEIGIYWKGGEWKVDLLINLEEYQNHLKTLNQLYLDGILVSASEAGSDFFARIMTGYSEEDVRNKMTEAYQGDWKVVACPQWNEQVRAGGWRTVIMNYSEKKEIACQILSLIYTDRELSEMLAYGSGFIEDSDRVKTDINRSILYGNRFIIRPEISDPEDYSEKIIKIFQDSEKKEWMGFWPDMRELQEKWKEIVLIQLEHENFYYGLSENMEKEEALIREELKTAGIDEILEELNRQMMEFQERER